MKLATTSETISFLRDLEEKCIAYYDALSSKIKEFSQFAKENKGFITQVQRTYQSVITDAIEGCYAFNLDSDNYALDASVNVDMDVKSAITKAIGIEKLMLDLYDTAASQSMALMADVPRVLRLIAKKREARLRSLERLINP